MTTTMTKKNRSFILSAISLLAIVLTSCSGGSGGLPPVRPTGHITGYAIDSAISGGTVSVYSFADGKRGAKLGSGKTDDTGAFSVPVQAPSQIVMVEITGGSYIEEASGKEVKLGDGQNLRSLIQYQSGQAVSTNVTPLTHMATALAQYKANQGAAVAQAMDKAFGEIDTFFNLDSRGVMSLNISKGTADQTTLDDNTLYGFYMAGLSSWTAWLNQQNGHEAHSTYTSVGLAQTMYKDIGSNGLLDGQMLDASGNNSIPVQLEKVALNADAYRLAFSLQVIAAAKSTQNKTGITADNAELMAAANKIAALDETSPLMPKGTTALTLGAQPISVSVDPAYYTGFFGGHYSFDVTINSLVGAESITVAQDQPNNVVQTVGALDAPQPHLDLSTLPSGTHTLYVTAVNVFGAVSDPYSFDVTIDNDAPTLSINSQPYASATSVQVTGTYQDTGGAGVKSVEVVLGQNTTLATLDDPAPGQWSATVDNLAKGNNPLTVVVTDKVGNSYSNTQFQVYLDDIAPVIANADPLSTHSTAQFSNGDGTSAGHLLLTNDTTEPLYFETNNSEFTSTASPTNLDSNGIPYFKFTVSDDRAPSDATNPQDIQVEMQYQRLDASNQTQTLDDWHPLNRYQLCDTASPTCEYYIPLAAPYLNANPSWDQTTPADTQIINVRVSDQAGNQTTAQFRFRADFYVPPIPVCADLSCTQGELVVNDLDPFTGASNFTSRDTVLYNTTLDTTTYTFTNPSNKSMYIQLAEPLNTAHTVVQAIEQELRHHLVQKTTTTEWQIVRLTNTDANSCPLPETIGNPPQPKWRSITSVVNYTLSGPVTELVPAPVIDQNVSVQTDDLTSLSASSGWINRDHFDKTFLVLSGIAYDYWNGVTYSYALDTRTPPICTEQRYFQKQELYAYVSNSGYPRDEVTDLPSITAGFNTNGYIVTADGTVVPPNAEGWYLIPANANVVITKVVSTDTTPDLVFNEADFSLNASYTVPSVRDKSLTWTIDRNLNINTMHNTGEANISSMSQRANLSTSAPKVYVTARP